MDLLPLYKTVNNAQVLNSHMLENSVNPLPNISREDIVHFILTHQFKKIGQDKWFILLPSGDKFSEPGRWLLPRTFSLAEIVLIAVGLNESFQTRLL